eukprot:6142125-Pleurochrysis_carterae.AAC.1
MPPFSYLYSALAASRTPVAPSSSAFFSGGPCMCSAYAICVDCHSTSRAWFCHARHNFIHASFALIRSI